MNEVFAQDIKIKTQSMHVYQIEGKVLKPKSLNNDSFKNMIQETEIVINSGKYKGFLKDDGTFVIKCVQPGSYLLEVVSSKYVYEPVKIEINNRGKIRARKVNNMQPFQVILLQYPLKLKTNATYNFFQKREHWKITDIIFSPMVLMMIVPLILLILLQKSMNNSGFKNEMENLQLPNFDSSDNFPDVTKMFSNLIDRTQQKQLNHRLKNCIYK
ncbi:hypothetical protein PVAND_006583 [Polypedilum vanderplanki]|uniref:ER membrane protein complex subunit 7 beta-sandwich domain-containing protein n=1 Tax=Polypedilum vanderplanki TaxID=319348 RepID=A0A9J6C5B4_POLVA|nr:hypothetical protein PVAND_006583 [Polypedilum vanderplanki]